MNRRQFLLGTTAIVGLQLAPPALRSAPASAIFASDAFAPSVLMQALPRWQIVGESFYREWVRQIETHERVTILKGRH